jgi:hypothetical protein
VLISSHYYAMGPAGGAGIDAQKLLSNDPRLAREMPVLVAGGKTAGVPYRMTEGNSCYHGGQPGVSDAFASALSAADYLLRVAQAGYAGVNLHSGGEGYYAPITGEPNATKLRPEYYGMLLAQQFAGATFRYSVTCRQCARCECLCGTQEGLTPGGDGEQVRRSGTGEAARRDDPSNGVLEADCAVARCERRRRIRTRKHG